MSSDYDNVVDNYDDDMKYEDDDDDDDDYRFIPSFISSLNSLQAVRPSFRLRRRARLRVSKLYIYIYLYYMII